MNDDMDNCRECGHFRFLHKCKRDAFGKLLYHSLDDKCDCQRCEPGTDHSCNCEEFVPEDNLDYVEYLAEKRGLV